MEIYEVFARVRREEPLRLIGSVTAESLELAKVYAYKTYDEEPWIEMVLVPRTAMAEVMALQPAVRGATEEGAR